MAGDDALGKGLLQAFDRIPQMQRAKRRRYLERAFGQLIDRVATCAIREDKDLPSLRSWGQGCFTFCVTRQQKRECSCEKCDTSGSMIEPSLCDRFHGFAKCTGLNESTSALCCRDWLRPRPMQTPCRTSARPTRDDHVRIRCRQRFRRQRCKLGAHARR